MSIGSTASGVAATAAPGRRRLRGPALDWLVVLAVAVIGLAHALVVGRLYHVGSFDDDASYILTAQALAHGAGFGGMLQAGIPLISTYPPGFALLLTPLALVAGSATWPYRALVLACYLAVYPLTEIWLRRLGARRWLRVGVLLLFALSPVSATYATMVMVEAPFLVAFLGLVLLAPRWAADRRGLSAAGVGTVLLAAASIWLKEAGVGVVAGLALWLVLRHRWRRAVSMLVLVGLSIVPILAYRVAVGTSLAGSRYSSEIGGNLGLSAVPGALRQYAQAALPYSVVPHVRVPSLFMAVTVTVTAFVLVGVVVWLRRYREPAAVMALVYLAETLVYPYINERRVVLVLPVVLAWYLVGAEQVVRWIAAAAARWLPPRRVAAALAVAGALLVVVPLAWQWDRNYRLDPGQHTSRPLGSPYLGFVAAVTAPGDVVETPYVFTTSLATGRRTADDAFTGGCDEDAIRKGALDDGAGVVVEAAFNTPPPVQDCQVPVLEQASWAIPLYRTGRDDATVYELLGPGTVHPDLVDSLSGGGVTSRVDGGTALTWSWSRPRRLTLLSLGGATAEEGTASRVLLEWSDAAGRWHRAATAPGPVGDGEKTPFLVWRPERPVSATAVRVVVLGGSGVGVSEVHALTEGPQ